MSATRQQALSEFGEVFGDPYKRAKEWKKSNKREVIGCLPMYVPEEIIHAAGMLPITIFEDEEPVALADKHLQTNTCELIRSTFDMTLRGKLDFLDGLVIPEICDQLRFFGDVWEKDHPFPYFDHLWTSLKLDEVSRAFLIQEWNRFKSTLGEFAGKEISDQTLWESIQHKPRHSILQRKLYTLRREKPGLISAKDMVKVVVSSMLMPKEEHSKLLTELIKDIRKETPPTNEKIKVVLVGKPCTIPEEKMLDLIEEVGMVVVDDDLYAGGRYPATDVLVGRHPIEALVDYQLNMIPCTTRQNPAYFSVTEPAPDYSDYVIQMVKRSSAKGAIILKVMYCDPFDLEYPYLVERLSAEGIPYFALTTGYEMESSESIRTRLQAFREMIESK